MNEAGGDDVVLAAARASRYYLNHMLQAADVGAVDASIREALEHGGLAAVAEIERLIADYPALQNWFASYLERGFPAELMPQVERQARPPGDAGALTSPPHARCPVDGNYVRFLRYAYEPAGTCPDHAVELVPPSGR